MPKSSTSQVSFSHLLCRWLKDLGYSHCFTVAGGNSMHLLARAEKVFAVVPFAHEVSAGIAAEYFNHTSCEGKAFVLVTTGPGLTNLATSIAGAWLESRELVVIAGAVKSSDLRKSPDLRQRGIQEISGADLYRSVSKKATLYDSVCSESEFKSAVMLSVEGRKGPVIIEVCLDTQAQIVPDDLSAYVVPDPEQRLKSEAVDEVLKMLTSAKRPAILLGGGIDRDLARGLSAKLESFGVPVLLTWNAADYLSSSSEMYFGRPDNWGQRSSNLIIQQADFLLALGAKLGLQQTGFSWENFLPNGRIWAVNIDEAELDKGHPTLDRSYCEDANVVLETLMNLGVFGLAAKDWVDYCRAIRERFLPENENPDVREGFVRPHRAIQAVQELAEDNAVFVPSSSGGAEISMMQTIELRGEQRLVVNKGLASMGYALPGAIGVALGVPNRQVVCFEGDGSLAQSLSEFAMLAARGFDLKLVILSNGGYSSIRATQSRFMDGRYVGCDEPTGLYLPEWSALADAFGLQYRSVRDEDALESVVGDAFRAPGTWIVEIHVDQEQTYFPRVSSELHNDGRIESKPLHEMSPELSEFDRAKYLRYI